MAKRVKCLCGGDPACRLCGGAGRFEYTPGPRGWQPFPCPTCGGGRAIDDPAGGRRRCVTCAGAGSVDPAGPPPSGLFDIVCKIFFGA